MENLIMAFGAKCISVALTLLPDLHHTNPHPTSFTDPNSTISQTDVQVTMMYRDAGIQESDIAKTDWKYACKGTDTTQQLEQSCSVGAKTPHPNMKFYGSAWDSNTGSDKMNYKLTDMDTGQVLWDATFKTGMFSKNLGNNDAPLSESVAPNFKKMCVVQPGRVKLYDFSAGPSNVIENESFSERMRLKSHEKDHTLSQYLFDRSLKRYPHRLHEIVAVTKLHEDAKFNSSYYTSKRLSEVYKYRYHMFDPPKDWKDIELADGRFADPGFKPTSQFPHRDRGLTTPWRIMVRKGEWEEQAKFPQREVTRAMAQFAYLVPDNKLPPDQMLALGKVGMLPTKTRMYDHDNNLWAKLDENHRDCGQRSIEHPGRDWQDRFPESYSETNTNYNPDDIKDHCFQGYHQPIYSKPFNWFDLYPKPNEVMDKARDLSYFAGHHAADPPVVPAPARPQESDDEVPMQPPWSYYKSS